MNPSQPPSCTAFAGSRLMAAGTLTEVALKVKAIVDRAEHLPILIFDDETSEQIEVDFRGVAGDVLKRLAKPASLGVLVEGSGASNDGAPRGPGRPKLGVIGREVTLLPRHWEWLNDQPGGPSVTLRKLVEEAKRANQGIDRVRRAQEAAYKFMSVMAGNLPNFEEATRLLFSKKKNRFAELENCVRGWPKDIRKHALFLVQKSIQLV